METDTLTLDEKNGLLRHSWLEHQNVATSGCRVTMNPAHYYYGPFREHFAAFWQSLETQGSVSRVRAQLNPSQFSTQADQHFSVVDLVVRPSQGLKDHLTGIAASDQTDFLCALFYTVLIDQVMYAHRQPDYSAFRALTQYPKMDRTAGYSRALMMANPYELFEDDVARSRNIPQEGIRQRFTAWVDFVVQDLRSFFERHQIGTSTWADVRDAMLCDPSCTWGSLGMSLADALRFDATHGKRRTTALCVGQ